MHSLLCAVTAVLLAASGPAGAQSAPTDDIIFVPPPMGAPANRVGAGTRGGLADSPGLTLLAPPGGGMTASPSPTLYWWLDAPVRGELSVSFGAADAARPLMATREQVDLAAGQHAFALADYGLRLAPDRIYRWSVTLKPADGGPALTGTSFVEVAKGDVPPDGADASRQAAAGNWYDAFALVAEDAALAAQRDALLRQAGVDLESR